MSVDQIIALSASLGAFLSAIAAFLAVKQNTKQREASYKPELVLARTIFTASKGAISASSFAECWVVDKKVALPEEGIVMPFLSLPLHNVGLGAAKEIKINWSFPIETLISTVNQKAQRALVAAYFVYEKETVSLKSDVLSASTSIWGNQKQELVDYVLPASTDQEGVKIRVPPAYIELVSALMYFSMRDPSCNGIPEMPVLDAQLEYFDIGGGSHSVSFHIELHLIAVSMQGEAFHGYLQSKKFA